MSRVLSNTPYPLWCHVFCPTPRTLCDVMCSVQHPLPSVRSCVLSNTPYPLWCHVFCPTPPTLWDVTCSVQHPLPSVMSCVLSNTPYPVWCHVFCPTPPTLCDVKCSVQHPLPSVMSCVLSNTPYPLWCHVFCPCSSWLDREERRGLQPGQVWYLASMHWWNHWADYVNYKVCHTHTHVALASVTQAPWGGSTF